jgi:hypothetical protein
MASAQLARNVGRIGERRSQTSTVPGDATPPSHAWLSDRPSWCVDMGPTLRAMATCEVWLALAKGELSPDTKVWREGLAYWDRLDRVPEFALALPDVDAWGPVSATVPKGAARTEEMVFSPDASEKPAKTLAARLEQDREEWPLEALLPEVPSAEEIEARELAASGDAARRLESSATRRASEPMVAGVATMAPPSDFATPAPVVVEQPDAPRQPARSRRRLARFDRKSALSVVFGAAVAVTALVMATTGPVPGRTTAPSGFDSRPSAASAPERGVSFQEARALPPVEPEARDAAEMPGDRGTANAAVEAERERTRAPRGPHAADRGQQRRARGGVSR